jgi:hypothetical protein
VTLGERPAVIRLPQGTGQPGVIGVHVTEGAAAFGWFEYAPGVLR